MEAIADRTTLIDKIEQFPTAILYVGHGEAHLDPIQHTLAASGGRVIC